MSSSIIIHSFRQRRFARKAIYFARKLSNYDDQSSATPASEWRKSSLERLEQKFTKDPSRLIDNEVDLQPEWKAMESRVTKRRTFTVDQLNGKTGRENIRRTDEDIWMESGLYDGGSNDNK